MLFTWQTHQSRDSLVNTRIIVLHKMFKRISLYWSNNLVRLNERTVGIAEITEDNIAKWQCSCKLEWFKTSLLFHCMKWVIFFYDPVFLRKLNWFLIAFRVTLISYISIYNFYSQHIIKIGKPIYWKVNFRKTYYRANTVLNNSKWIVKISQTMKLWFKYYLKFRVQILKL